MNPGDLVTVHFDGKDSGGEVITGLVLSCFKDVDSFHKRDNYSRWINMNMLIDGKQREVSVYWDDYLEVISESCPG